ncbi:hypothetical protein [Micromonospora sp. WMMD737]|uniref:hypothetical protein n=1 Tax=Micromonospora sp. WMMD737 TaxID=3404113 RepID=UPI003B93CB04
MPANPRRHDDEVSGPELGRISKEKGVSFGSFRPNPGSIALEHGVTLSEFARLQEIGRLKPAPAGSGSAVPGSVRIQGDPLAHLDYAGQWEIRQNNRYDAWVTLIPGVGNGYRVLEASYRDLEGRVQAKHRAGSGGVMPDGGIQFDIDWGNGSTGRYEGHFDEAMGFAGSTWDMERSDSTAPKVPWTARRTSYDLSPAPSGSSPGDQVVLPVLGISVVPDSTPGGYRITFGGSGFVGGEHFTLLSATIGAGKDPDFGYVSDGRADGLGRISPGTFLVTKPVGYSMRFRVVGDVSGAARDVGFD